MRSIMSLRRIRLGQRRRRTGWHDQVVGGNVGSWIPVVWQGQLSTSWEHAAEMVLAW
jgi:hypothetical protein